MGEVLGSEQVQSVGGVDGRDDRHSPVRLLQLRAPVSFGPDRPVSRICPRTHDDVEHLSHFESIPAGDFEAVDSSSLMIDPNFGAAR